MSPRQHRLLDNPIVDTFQRLGSLAIGFAALVMVTGLFSGWFTCGKNALLDPHTIAVARCLDSANNCKIYRALDSTNCRVSRVEQNYDSVSLWMIKMSCYQRRAMTLDQQVAAANDFNDLKQAWEKGRR